MKNKNVIITSVIVLLVAILGVFSYNTFLKEKPVEGSKTINVTVVNESNDYKKEYTYTTDAENLGDALDSQGMIGYDKSEGGRFIHTVDKIKADTSQQEWWNITINDKNAETGIDDIMIKDGDKIQLILKKGW